MIVVMTLRTTARSRIGSRIGRATAVIGCVLLLGSACSSASRSETASPTGTLNIVAGENFWGSIVSQLAGRVGHVTSIVSDPNADPHNYESSSNDARAVADADYVILNGAGYDAWAQKLISGNPNSKRKVFTVADLLGKKEGDNPHFWYNPTYVSMVADQITADLKSLDPTEAAYLGAQKAAFDTAMAPNYAQLAAIKSQFAGTPVASTESIFVYLAEYLGLNVLSPTAFMNAVAEGNDPPAPSVEAFQNLLANKQVRVLVFNEQTSTVVTTNLKALAKDHGIPVVGVTETIQPPNDTFEHWFGSELTNLDGALAGGAGTAGAAG
jgi:zinc/manganese transport system substrate-binding protein